MPAVEVLVLHGPLRSGKTTLCRAIAEVLRMADVPHAVIDLDDLSNVFPVPRRSFARENLQAIWPNYAAIPHLKVVIPSVIANQLEREQLRAATQAARFSVCELMAPESVLKDRLRARAQRILADQVVPVCLPVLSANRSARDQRLPGEHPRLHGGRGSMAGR